MPDPKAAIAPSPQGPRIKARKPTGEIGYPLILLAGDEKAGKSLVPVVLSRSPRVGMTYWFDLGEGAADEYAALPGSEYVVIEHDGSYREILEQTTAVWHEAARAAAAGEPPVVLVADSTSAEWTMLVNWTNDRARRSKNGQRKLNDDPDAEIDPTSNLWNDANKRHYRLMNLWMTFPGICILTARGKEVAVMDDRGQPTPQKTRKPEGQKGIAYDVDTWIWMSREPRTADLLGVRSLKVSPGDALPTIRLENGWDVLDLDAFIFDVIGAVGPKTDELKTLHGDALEGVLDLVMTAPTEGDLQAIWNRTKTQVAQAQYDDLLAAVNHRLSQLRNPATAEPSREGEANLNDHGPSSDAERLRLAAEARREAEAIRDRVEADARLLYEADVQGGPAWDDLDDGIRDTYREKVADDDSPDEQEEWQRLGFESHDAMVAAARKTTHVDVDTERGR